MATNPTIVVGHLNDQELKSSIDALVKHVQDGALKMATDFDTAIQMMKGSLRELGNTKVDFGNFKQTAREVQQTLDRQAEAIQKASGGKSSGVGSGYITFESDVEKGLTYIVHLNDNVDAQMAAIIEKEQKLVQEKEKEAAASREIAEQTQKATSKYITPPKEGEYIYKGAFENYQKMQLESNERTRQLQKETMNLNGSYNTLSNTLKNLTTQYQNLSAGGRSTERGTQLAEKIQAVRKAMQDLQTQMNRPLSTSHVFALPEKTLDDISYKMKQIASLRGKFAPQSEELRQLNSQYERLSRVQQEALGKSKELTMINQSLARSFNYMKNRIMFYLTVGATMSFVKQLVEIRGQYEMTERALGVLVDSAERGSQIFNELSNMALVSPYTLIELSNAAKQLVAYNVAAKDVVDTTRRLADMASAVGVPIERLTYALGQIKAYGYLNSRDARMFLNAGIPLVQQLAERYTQLEGRLVSTADVYDRIKKKAVSYEDVMVVINQMTDEGGRFFDFQAKMAETLKVQLANLTLAWNNMLNELGESMQGAISFGIRSLKALLIHWKDANKVLWDLIITYGIFRTSQIVMNSLLTKSAISTITYTNAVKGATAADYQSMLASQGLTRSRAILLAMWQRNNVALRQALVNMGLLTQAELTNIKFTKVLGAVWSIAINGLKAGLLALKSALVSILPMAAVFAAVDFALWIRNLGEIDEAISTGVGKSAKEASESLKEFLDTMRKTGTMDAIYSGEATPEQAKKTWNALREEIEKSSDASASFINELMREEDLTRRISKGFDLAQQIESATLKMKDLNDEIKISEDGWHGIFGEGLISDVKDATKSMENLLDKGEQGGYWDRFFYGGNGGKERLNEDIEEIDHEMYKLADNLKEVFAKQNIIEPNEVKEALERVRSQIKVENNLGGDVAKMFDLEFDKIMAREFRNIHDNATTLWSQVLNTIKKTSSTAFSQLTDDILDSNATWSKDQLDAIQKGIDKVRNEVPEYWGNVLDQMQNMINSREFKVRIMTEFGVNERDAIQKDFEQRYGMGMDGTGTWTTYGKYERKDSENSVEWGKRLGDELKAQKEIIKQADNVINSKNSVDEKIYNNALETKKAAEIEKEAIENVVDTYKLLLKDDFKNKKGSKKDVLGEAFSNEIQLIDEIQKRYKEYRKMGIDSQTAIARATDEYGKSLKNIGATLSKYGVKTKTSDELAKMDYRDVREYYKSLLAMANSLGNAKGVEAIEKAIAKLNVEIAKLDMKKVTDGLNTELEKFKDEYELAMELDASPEMSSAFMSMMGISEDDLNNLPRTYEQLAKKLQQGINNVFSENGITETFNLTENLKDDDFKKWVEENGHLLEDDFVKALDKIREYANKTRTDEAKNTIKSWDGLVEKYGELQSKLNKISREATKKQVDIIKQFGSDEDKSKAINLMNKINLEDNPQEIARLQKQLSEILQKVLSDNPDAFKISDAITNEQNRDSAKAQWENFKNSELYAETFDKLKYVGTSSIKAIIEELEKLKDKVKEDPASMKALMDAMNSAKDEWTKRDPFGGMARSMGSLISALKERRQATISLRKEEEKLRELQSDPNSDPQSIADQQNKVSKSEKRHKKSLEGVREAMAKFEETCKEASNAMQSVASLLDDVNNALGLAEDSDVSIAIKSMADGFSTMATVLGIVASAAALAQLSLGWVAAVAAALAVLVGLVTFLANRKDNHILKQIKESEETVKNLELSYKRLQFAVEDAFGTAVIGAQQAAIANKRLQLVELERQLQLQKSRDGKKRDEDAIRDLEGQIVDLKHEISESLNEITENLLGISSVGDAVENMVGSVIEALRSGENAIDSWNDSLDDMIANMIKKFVSTKMVGPLFEKVFDRISKDIQEKSQSENDTTQAIQSQLDSKIREYEAFMSLENGMVARINKDKVAEFEKEIAKLKNQLQDAESKSLSSSVVGQDDIVKYAEWINELKLEGQGIVDFTKDLIDAVGLDSGKTGLDLSALQQGIQSITEDQAGALEAYWNANTQQQYVQSDLLTQIRDAVVVMDFDSQLGTMGEILLQLQQSYQVQMSIQGIMEGWSTPNGMGVRVEMI